MQISTFLMFSGAAEEAMSLYVSLFPESRVLSLVHHGPEAGAFAGKVQQGIFELNGVRYRCFDSPVQHDFTFTPAISIFVDCDSAEQLENAFAALSPEGKVLMPVGAYGFSQRFAWVQDRFGVSWQLNLP
jgi:predicted 3-demethylubiquinone-9 3-methyltransferase (glyoxalase superfamily)